MKIKKFIADKSFIGGGSIVLFVFLIALFAPLISPYDPALIDVSKILMQPTADHLFGTDELGRDILSRIIWGARISLFVGFVSVGIAILTGMIIGSVAGYYGGFIDDLLMRFVDIMLAIPTFFLVLAVIAILEPNIWNIMIVIGTTSWMGVARLIRGQFLSLKEMDYVIAAKATGSSDMRIIFKHILPNSLSPIYVSAILGIAGAILVESSLSFLGLGVQPPVPSWGSVLSAGKDNIEISWWLSVFPGMAILITVLGYNLLGEGLQEILNPRSDKR